MTIGVAHNLFIHNTAGGVVEGAAPPGAAAGAVVASAARRARADYAVAAYTVRLRKRPPNELVELNHFDGKCEA